MDANLIEVVAQYGISGVLLLIVFWWLARNFLPEHQRQHRAELERIMECHDNNTGKLAAAVERNSRVVQFNSQALLVQSFANGGLEREEAEQIARRIQVAVMNGSGRTGNDGAGVFDGPV